MKSAMKDQFLVSPLDTALRLKFPSSHPSPETMAGRLWVHNRYNGVRRLFSDELPFEVRGGKEWPQIDAAVGAFALLPAESGPDWYEVTFTPGPRAIKWMEEQDRIYLNDIKESNPKLFLKEMTSREDLLYVDQIVQFGLDLSLPHHRNLQREFAADVARISGARSSGVDVRRGGAGGARVAPEGSRRDAGRSDSATLIRPGTTASIAPSSVITAAPTRKAAITVEENIREQVILLRDRDSSKRKQTANALWTLAAGEPKNQVLIGRTEGAIEALVDLLRDDNYEVKKEAARALFTLSTHPENKVLIGRMEGAVVALIGVLRDGNTGVRANAARALMSLASNNPENQVLIGRTKGAIEALMGLLRDGNDEVREAAAWALKSLTANNPENQVLIGRTKGVIEALVGLLRHDNYGVRREAAGALENLAMNPSISALIDAKKPKDATTTSSRGGGGGGSSAASYRPALVISSTRDPDFDRKERERIEAEKEREAALRKKRDIESAEKFQRDWDAERLREATTYVAKQKRDYVSDEQRKADVSDAWDCDIDKIKADYHKKFGYDISSEGRDMMETEIADKKDRQRDELRAIDGDSSVCSVM